MLSLLGGGATDSVLKEFGFIDQEIAELQTAEVIRQH